MSLHISNVLGIRKLMDQRGLKFILCNIIFLDLIQIIITIEINMFI